MYYFEKLSSNDYYLNYLNLLEQLTVVNYNNKKISFEEFNNNLKNINTDIYVLKENYKNNIKIVGTGTIFIEKKFIHNMGCVAHIEDIVIDSNSRGKGYGKIMMNYLIDIAVKNKCYKIILDCSYNNIDFYKKVGFTKKANQMAMYLHKSKI